MIAIFGEDFPRGMPKGDFEPLLPPSFVIGLRPGRATESGMAYDEHLADRVRELITGDRRVTEKRMFGGLAFLVDGKMAVTVSRAGGLMVRVDPADTETLLRRAHTQPFVMRGREMTGWLRVDAEGVRTKRQLEQWVRRGTAYAVSLSGTKTR